MKHLAPALGALLLALTIAPSTFADDTAAPAAAPPAEPQSGASEMRYPPSSVRPKIVIGGIVVIGLAYAATFAASSNWPGGIGTKIPFVGPWIALGKTSCALDATTCAPQLTQKERDNGVSCAPGDSSCRGKVIALDVGFALAGILQIAGLGLIAEGIAMKTESTTAPKKPSLALGLPGGVTLHPVPTVSAHLTGLGIVGSF